MKHRTSHKKDRAKPDAAKTTNSRPNRKGSAPRKRGGPSASNDHVRLYGLHAVRAALANPARSFVRLCVTENALKRLGDIPQTTSLEITITGPQELDAMVAPDAVHQGVVLICAPLSHGDASELFHLADKKMVLMLDQITDPHNVGAILRSASAFGVDAVIVTHRNTAMETGALAKAASGALDIVPIIEVRNFSKALDELNDMGFESFGLDSEGPAVLEAALSAANPERAVLVLGSEGKGLRQQTRETCKHLARLDMPGEIKSLNVSNAAALSLYVVRAAIYSSK
ncbi:23S rRNA (guanosine(2251)-2'-O)-methyltransferase RlmB [Pseudahrensia aquimaris]|uniref:23S rRNA (Guanosine(2251)-2'-O)-methyltransferase RlmB n=1 Tax=Pseudahrensia aquimaris TaxID=744461 RepID=A0ABW3FN72_9HYPH